MSEENIQSLDTVKVAVGKIINNANSDSEFGKFKYYVNTKWEGGTLCKNQIRRAHKLLVDEPPAFGGDDLSASPVELVLAALGSCQMIMFSALAATREIELEECEVTLKAQLNVRGLLGIKEDAHSVYPGFSSVTYETNLKSSASTEIIRDLVQDVERQCPVMDMLTRSVSVEGTTLVNDKLLSLKQSSSIFRRLKSIFGKK
ncbi:MAG: OsmC family protein [Gammaproteobacteria bacterium]